jgi:hypothetical protein
MEEREVTAILAYGLGKTGVSTRFARGRLVRGEGTAGDGSRRSCSFFFAKYSQRMLSMMSSSISSQTERSQRTE